MLDYIIVGQGLAGSLLSYFLLEKGNTLAVIDEDHHKAASAVAAGIVNPITGRRFVKSWRMDELLPFAMKTYQQIEAKLQEQFFFSKQVTMLFRLPETENNWMARTSDEGISPYIYPNPSPKKDYEQLFGPLVGHVEYQQSGRLAQEKLIKSWRTYLQENCIYRVEKFDYSELNIEEDSVEYNGVEARSIIFCEGPRAIQNPYFNYLPFNLAKGEVLLIKIEDYPFRQKMVKDSVFIVPLENGLFWAGSSYNRNYQGEEPTELERFNLISQLQKMLKTPFSIVEHISAVRPTVRDRRPFLGQHPEMKSLYIFNGLGAKGSYLGPYFANHLVQYLQGELELEKEVDIRRCL